MHYYSMRADTTLCVRPQCVQAAVPVTVTHVARGGDRLVLSPMPARRRSRSRPRRGNRSVPLISPFNKRSRIGTVSQAARRRVRRAESAPTDHVLPIRTGLASSHALGSAPPVIDHTTARRRYYYGSSEQLTRPRTLPSGACAVAGRPVPRWGSGWLRADCLSVEMAGWRGSLPAFPRRRRRGPPPEIIHNADRNSIGDAPSGRPTGSAPRAAGRCLVGRKLAGAKLGARVTEMRRGNVRLGTRNWSCFMQLDHTEIY